MKLRKFVSNVIQFLRETALPAATAAVTYYAAKGISDANQIPESAGDVREDLKEQFEEVLRGSNLLLVPYGISEFFYALQLAGGGQQLSKMRTFVVGSGALIACVAGYFAVTIGPDEELIVAGVTAAGSLLLANIARRLATRPYYASKVDPDAPEKSRLSSTVETLKDLLVVGAPFAVAGFAHTGIDIARSEELDPTGLKDTIKVGFTRISSVYNVFSIYFSQLQMLDALLQSNEWRGFSRRRQGAVIASVLLSWGSAAYALSCFDTPQQIIAAGFSTSASVLFADVSRRIATVYSAAEKSAGRDSSYSLIADPTAPTTTYGATPGLAAPSV